jgi:hypothetical protein
MTLVKYPAKIYDETWAKEITRKVNSSVILISPDGTKYKLEVANDGTLSTTLVV